MRGIQTFAAQQFADATGFATGIGLCQDALFIFGGKRAPCGLFEHLAGDAPGFRA
jgi:hypothetical protein